MIAQGSIPILDGWQAYVRLLHAGERCDLAESNAKGTLIVVALVAFLVGRCSATPEPSSISVSAAEEAAPAAAQPLLPRVEPTSTPSTQKAAETTANPWTSGSATDAVDELADEPEPVADPESASEPDEDVYYQSCAAVRAAGAAPLNEGEPGYAPKLDRDRDGVACE